jgi:tryptophan-rich sensory protein
MRAIASEPRLRSLLILGFLVGSCQLAGASGALVTDPSFYQELVRPSWAPPGWLFAPVWITLYTLMGVAAWLVWRTGPGRRTALWWFAIQLILNAAWTPVFFGLRSLGGGLVVIILLDLAIIATIVAFARRSRLAAALLVPYALWVGFATALSVALWSSNR